MADERAAASYAGVAGREDLESPRLAAVDKPPDLVALLVHVSSERKLPPLTTTTSARESGATQSQCLQPSTQHQHQYAEPPGDKHAHLQVSQIATPPTTTACITSAVPSPQDSPALDDARLTEPFSPVFPLHDSEPEERDPTPAAQGEFLRLAKRWIPQ